ncbi:hypothetical protein LBMAG56_40930 [Verrucomicrobiota bacterium]|nr:hypothetical protein LBMAG56_40930 [Verrucomicrobiota bacterium]
MNASLLVRASRLVVSLLLFLALPVVSPAADAPPVNGPASATKERPWVNTLGMKFVPVAGTEVLFSVWETRVQDYAAFENATNREGDRPSFMQEITHPVVEVNWDDAQAFAKWLTEKERRDGTLAAGQSYRLPQDWEWSVAVGLPEARAGTPKEKAGVIKDVYPWGTQWPPPVGAGNFSDQTAKAKGSRVRYIGGYNDGYAWTSPVGSFGANRFGLFDLSGNAWEWCEDWYDAEQKRRVLRGGSWDVDHPFYLLSSYRVSYAPVYRTDDVGFRLVLVGSGGAR